MIILKNVQFQKRHNLLKNKNLREGLDNNLTFKLYIGAIRSNIKTNSTLLKLVNKN